MIMFGVLIVCDLAVFGFIIYSIVKAFKKLFKKRKNP